MQPSHEKSFTLLQRTVAPPSFLGRFRFWKSDDDIVLAPILKKPKTSSSFAGWNGRELWWSEGVRSLYDPSTAWARAAADSRQEGPGRDFWSSSEGHRAATSTQNEELCAKASAEARTPLSSSDTSNDKALHKVLAQTEKEKFRNMLAEFGVQTYGETQTSFLLLPITRKNIWLRPGTDARVEL